MSEQSCCRPRVKSLGALELVAIALGGMVGGGIFTILGISVAMIGVYTPIAIAIGGGIAALAAYSYIKLGVYYKDEGATYSFLKRSFPARPFAASLIGWWVIFGYISTLALYAYTFSSYAISSFSFAENEWIRKAVAGGIIALFTLINVWSVKGMGKVEDLMVYSKLVILAIISLVLVRHGDASLPVLLKESGDVPFYNILVVASLTFVAYEGFQLVINAVGEMETPERNIPLAIYTAILLAVAIYVVIAIGALMAIPFKEIIENQEYALAAGAGQALGHWGSDLVILGALLATSSAISGTVFGASRQMAVIAQDGYFPVLLAKRKNNIPVNAILAMSALAFCFILAGSLQIILEFGSITFLLVSLLIAATNHKMRQQTNSHAIFTSLSMLGLLAGTIILVGYKAMNQPEQLLYILGLYAFLTISAFAYAKRRKIVAP
ncbi:MAG: APC family permease [Hyphomicrobiaceae bacterium]|nr:APC family permease [Hyphomicrobiaceae bacterium]